MSIVRPQLEKYLYHGLAGERTVSISEDGITFYDFTLPSAMCVGDALAYWAAAATASVPLLLTYTFEISASTEQITFAATGAFWLTLDTYLTSALGFSVASWNGAASYSSDEVPMAIMWPLNAGYDAHTPDEEAVRVQWRWGRGRAFHHARHRVSRLAMTMTAAKFAAAKVVLTSELRAYIGSDTANPYDRDHLDGYHDLQPHEWSEYEAVGVADNVIGVDVLCSVAE